MAISTPTRSHRRITRRARNTRYNSDSAAMDQKRPFGLRGEDVLHDHAVKDDCLSGRWPDV